MVGTIFIGIGGGGQWVEIEHKTVKRQEDRIVEGLALSGVDNVEKLSSETGNGDRAVTAIDPNDLVKGREKKKDSLLKNIQ